MTTDEMRKAKEGKDYWFYYVAINGYSFRPSEAGLKKISRLLDLNLTYLKRCLNLYLEA